MSSAPKIKPQRGPQNWLFLSEADIIIYGGAAGGGKSWSIINYFGALAAHYGEYRCAIFRRNATDISLPGGLWDEATKSYPEMGGDMVTSPRKKVTFPDGGMIQFLGCEHEKDRFKFQGLQVDGIGFDELTHFTEIQFFYIAGRVRSTSGLPKRVIGTCNPDADSWVRQLIDWWIGDDGYPNMARAGALRYFVRIADKMHWSDNREELEEKFGVPARSITFIPASLEDNKILTDADPTYLANLMSLSHVEQEQLAKGNWDIRFEAGTVFKREWFNKAWIDVAPETTAARLVRFWDLAATEPKKGRDPDATASCLMAEMAGVFYLLDITHDRLDPGGVEQLLFDTAEQDRQIYGTVATRIEQEGGASGKIAMNHLTRLLAGYDVRGEVALKNKLARANPFAAAVFNGHVRIVHGPNDQVMINEFVGFPDADHDDIVDACSGAYAELHGLMDEAKPKASKKAPAKAFGMMW